MCVGATKCIRPQTAEVCLEALNCKLHDDDDDDDISCSIKVRVAQFWPLLQTLTELKCKTLNL